MRSKMEQLETRLEEYEHEVSLNCVLLAERSSKSSQIEPNLEHHSRPKCFIVTLFR